MANLKRQQQKGLSLIELMIALVLGLIIILGVGQIFFTSQRTFATSEGLARLQENGRFAVDFIGRDTRMAAHIGCTNAGFLAQTQTRFFNGINIAGAPAGLQYVYRFQVPVEGWEANGTEPGAATVVLPDAPTTAGGWTPPLPGSLAGQVVGRSDVFVLRYLSETSADLVDPFSNPGGSGNPPQLWVARTDLPADFLVSNALYGVSSCLAVTYFQGQVNNATPAIVTAPVAGSPGNSRPTWRPQELYGELSTLNRMHTVVFYVGIGASGEPALFRSSLQMVGGSPTMVAQELLEGVESMQVTFGLDRNRDGAVDEYLTAAQINGLGAATAPITNLEEAWRQVLALRVGLLMRSADRAAPLPNVATFQINGTDMRSANATNTRLRAVYQQVFALRNRVP